ncbi:MAG: hypothetical protein ACM3ML_13685 [Micromonosporaceae bacterium]
MPWRWACWTAGAALLVLAVVVLMLQVQVHGAGTPSRSCGSAWDVVAGRMAWPQWWSGDLADTAGGRDVQLVRTVRCPGAVNRRILVSGGLALAAVGVVAAGELAARRSMRSARPASTGLARRLRTLAAILTVLGGLLTAGGLAGIALLVADPSSPLFWYVSRPVVVLAGLLLLLPAILLVAIGRGASVMAAHLADVEATREKP